ncbi:hypothetical protein [Ahrensia sp. R2A130]|uniref:hypothetical protein n=1 Tax=Ahrensia sp. R2A130 TaxID=744979 RepID=UPI0001E0BC6C|nr:hypothetical protein [Ahrensia sp. R2A130]EFL89438.1 putative ATP-binding protein [Ahrensia sp. R2A130]
MTKYLTHHATVERRFQKSIRLDADLGSIDGLHGYVVHETARAALETTCASIARGQGAFTWTGPYGGGKSSLALSLASSVLPEGEARDTARTLLGECIKPAFDGTPGEWLPVVLTGRRADPVEDLRAATADAVAQSPGSARTKRGHKLDASGQDVILRLSREAEARPDGGVLVIIDEMGKYLEGASDLSIDIHFFQDLAETANRSGGRLIVIGILHQAFDRYAERLGSRVQNEWAKIQGRFVDIPIVTATDEVIDLIGRAITVSVQHSTSASVSELVASDIAERRPGTPDDLAERLDACWPLHPVTASLLGPVTRRRFGQNERSLFGFLSSAEPNGFQEFLDQTRSGSNVTFSPSDLWDYLRINLEPAIQASPDGHRWSLAADAIERAQRHADALHEQIAKTVAIIDLFRNGSGIVASQRIVEACLIAPRATVQAALEDLVRSSSLVFRRHLGAYAVYAGSDFDIEAEIVTRMDERGSLDIRTLNELAGLKPVLAKAHYFDTGTPRWFDTRMTEIGGETVSIFESAVSSEAAGRFILGFPSDRLSLDEAHESVKQASNVQSELPIIVGLPPNYEAVRSLGRELSALRDVQRESAELEGDATARREVEARIALLTGRLEEELRLAFDGAKWFQNGAEITTEEGSMSRLASDQAEIVFKHAPVVHSELANRQKPSSNTNAAIRALLKGVADATGEHRFGIKGYPPEVGLAATTLEATGLYREAEEGWAFVEPANDDFVERNLAPLWSETDKLLASGERIRVADLYDEWRRPPFGVRNGLMPILLVAYLRTRQVKTAVYVENMFQPSLDDLVIDRLLQDPSDIALRRVLTTKNDRTAMKMYAAKAHELTGWSPPAEPLPVAQALVEFAFKLPGWARHAHGALSSAAKSIRRGLLHADDPHDLFAKAFPEAVGGSDGKTGQRVCDALEELRTAQPRMLDELRGKMLAALKHQGSNFEPLQARAHAVENTASDDLKLSGFISRLAAFDGSTAHMEAICGLVTGQPVSGWRDLEPKRAAVQLADFAYRFRRVELFGDTGEAPTQTAVMMMAGVGTAERSVVRRAQISVAEQATIEPIASEIRKRLQQEGLSQDLLLAVLAEVSHDLLEDDGEADVTVPLIPEEEASA